MYFGSRSKQNTDLESGIDADQHLLHAHLHRKKFAKNLHVVMHRPTIHANDPYFHRNNVYFGSRNKQNTDLESGIDADQHLLHAHLQKWTIFATKFECYNALQCTQMIRFLTETTCILGVEAKNIQIWNQESILIITFYMHISRNGKNLH